MHAWMSIRRKCLSGKTYSCRNTSLRQWNMKKRERICGPDRNPYYKTDHDATATCLKEDYYSGLSSNLHAAYNAQVLVIKGFACAYYVSHSRSDINDLIPTLEAFFRIHYQYPKNLCTDSGYGSMNNYQYLELPKIGNYVKYQCGMRMSLGNDLINTIWMMTCQ